jgi:hypothetical protein
MKAVRIIEHLLIISLFAAVVYFVFQGVINPPEGYSIYADDMWRSYGFFRRFFVQSVNEGVIPWWNPYQFSGTPFLANPSVSYFYPPTWVFFILPFNQAYAAIFAIHVFIAMISMFWFMCRVLKLPLIAAVGPAIGYGLSGYFMSRVWAGHGETLAASALIPWVFGSFVLVSRKFSLNHIVLAATALAVQIYSGYLTMSLFTLEAIGVMVLLSIIFRRSLVPLAGVILAAVLGFCLSAFQLLPNLEFFGQSIRNYVFPYSWVATGSLIPDSLYQLINPFALGDQYNFHGPPPNYPEQAMFFGLTILIMAVFALVWQIIRIIRKNPASDMKEKNLMLLSLMMIAGFGMWLSFGNNITPDLLRLLWQYIPTYQHIRIPSRHVILFIFAVVSLSGYGIRLLKNWWLQIPAIILIILELFPVALHFVELKPLPETGYDREIIRAVKDTTVPYRFLPNFGVWINQRDAFDADAAMVNGVYSATGYDPSILTNYYNFIDAANRNSQTSILEHNVQIPYLDIFSPYTDFLNIRFVMVPSDYDPLGGINTTRFKKVLESKNRSYRIYENTYAMPKFFMVKKAKVLSDPGEVTKAIISREVDPKTTLLLSQTEIKNGQTGEPNCTETEVPIVRTSSYSPNELIVTTESTCNAYLATSEIMYPGWTAEIDGKDVPMYTNHLAFRSLYVPGGRHVVVMRYVPTIFYLGFGVTLGTFLMLLVLMIIFRSSRSGK